MSEALVIAYAVHQTGVREIIGLDIGEVESGAFWVEFLHALNKRGLAGVRLAVSDDHEGLEAAIAGFSPVRGSGAPCTSSETCSTTAIAISAAWSPPRCGRCSTPPTKPRRASGSVS